MSKRQFGFTKGLSTIDAINHVLSWTENRTEKYVHAVFLDISGAFDCLWWPQLDMQQAGCSSGLIELTKSYLDVALRIYKSVFVPQMGYAASVWAEKCMASGQRRARANMALRLPLLAITGAYKTTSTMALQVLAGVPPLDLELKKLARIERIEPR